MRRPGSRWLALARRWCTDLTLTRVVEPLVADMQVEHHAAMRDGRLWYARLVVAMAAASLARALAASAARDALTWVRAWSSDDQRELTRLVRVTLVIMAVMTAMLSVSPAVNYAWQLGPERAHLVVLLVPQALPIAAPWGLTFGILYGLAGTPGSTRLRTAALMLAFLASLGMWVAVGWVVPPANQAFRVAASGMPNIGRGLMEMTRPELERKIVSLDGDGLIRSARQARLLYARRDALPGATLSLAVFTVIIAPKRRPRGWMLATVACALLTSYWSLQMLGDAAIRNNTLPVWTGIWFANLAFVVAAVLFSGPAMVRRVRLLRG